MSLIGDLTEEKKGTLKARKGRVAPKVLNDSGKSH